MDTRLMDSVEGTLEKYNANRLRQIAGRRTKQPVAYRHRCRECGLKIRGPNHREGDDHKRRSGKRAAA